MNRFSRSGPRRAAALLGALLCLGAPLARAVVSCSITTLSTASFGIYNPLSATALDGVATATITCTSTKNGGGETASVSITANAGTGSGGVFAPRKMTGPGATKLDYYIYIDSARTQVFGTGASGTFPDIGSGNASSGNPLVLTETLYGRIPAGQDVAVGAYSDTLLYTVNF